MDEHVDRARVAFHNQRALDGQTGGKRGSRFCVAGAAGPQQKRQSEERCRQCEIDGWGICRREGHCIIEDDFPLVVEKINSSDVMVFATPVYFADLSESMRAFLDRLRRICRHDSGRAGIEGKPAVGICVAGGGGGGAPACTVVLEKVLSTCGFAVVDMVPVRRQNLDLKLQVLEATGRWLAAPEGQRASS